VPNLAVMKNEWRTREPIDSADFRVRLAQEVAEIDREVYRLHAQQLDRAADAASWAVNSRSVGLLDG
jgi:hypothetical protein